MVDITEISAVMAAAGVLVGVIYYIVDMRHQSKVRQTDLIMRLQSDWRSREFRESYVAVMNLKFKDYDEYTKKYPLWDGMGTPEVRAVVEVCSFFDGVGILLHRKLIDIEMVDELFSFYIKITWEKVKPLIERRRKELDPTLRKWFEYLYNEMKKREQNPQQSTA
jgi:hypothetical protein